MATVYPTSLDTDDTLYVAKNGLQFTLSSDIDSAVTTIPVNEDTSAAAATGYLSILGEAVHYGSKTQFSFTGCTRHDDGTSPASHSKNDIAKCGLVATHHNSLKDAIKAIETKLGTGTTIDGSLLTNATITPAKLSMKPKVLAVGKIDGPIGTSFTFTPQSNSSDIVIAVDCSGYSTAAQLQTIQYNLDGGAAAFLTKLYFNTANIHLAFPAAWIKLSGLSVAAHTINIVPPGGAFHSDNNDSVTYQVIEYV